MKLTPTLHLIILLVIPMIFPFYHGCNPPNSDHILLIMIFPYCNNHIIIMVIITITITITIIIIIIIIIIALWSSIPGERTLPWDRPGAPGHCQRLWRPWLSGDVPAARRWWKSSSSTGHPKNGGDWWTSHFTWNINEYLRYILVGGLEHFLFFHIYWECHHPNWLWYFQRCWNHQPVYSPLKVDGSESWVAPSMSKKKWGIDGSTPFKTGQLSHLCP